MHSHIQGVFILLVVGIALLGTARIAAPVLQEAFGDEGAIVAESSDPEDVVDLAVSEVEVDAPLTSDEVLALQQHLTQLGFNPGPIDGIMGDNTRTSIAAAIEEYSLEAGSSNRAVLRFAESLIVALTSAETDIPIQTEGIPGADQLTPSGDDG